MGKEDERASVTTEEMPKLWWLPSTVFYDLDSPLTTFESKRIRGRVSTFAINSPDTVMIHAVATDNPPDYTCRSVEAPWWEALVQLTTHRATHHKLVRAQDALRDLLLWETIYYASKEKK